MVATLERSKRNLGMPQYRTKLTFVDALHVPLPVDRPEWVRNAIDDSLMWELQDKSVRIKSKHGALLVRNGWIVKNSSGDLNSFPDEVFERSYEPV